MSTTGEKEVSSGGRKSRRIAGAIGIVIGGAVARVLVAKSGSLWLGALLAVVVAVATALVTALLVGIFAARSAKDQNACLARRE